MILSRVEVGALSCMGNSFQEFLTYAAALLKTSGFFREKSGRRLRRAKGTLCLSFPLKNSFLAVTPGGRKCLRTF